MKEACSGVVAITAHNSTDIVYPSQKLGKGFMCTASGNIAAVFIDGTTATLPVTQNIFYPFSLQRINSTGTTATGLFSFI